MAVDYSVYLVTDNTPAILRSRDLVAIVKAAVEGGVTIVQLRDKTSDTGDLIRIAKQLHEVTKARNVPLLINDRVDVALAAGVEGVHIGQDDIDLASARRLLGPDAIIGVTANSIQEAVTAAEGGADYLGLGTVFSTSTKENTKSIVGTAGLREMLSALSTCAAPSVSTVCIGGINASNTQRVLYQSAAPSKQLDGVAVVSAIIGADDPFKAAQELKRLVETPPAFAVEQKTPVGLEKPDVIRMEIPPVLKALADLTPLCHNMTNMVVQNFAANVALCIGASPIMSNNGSEAPDLARLAGALVVNMGTVTDEGLKNYLSALRAYNSVGGPVVFDPVGAGATTQRRTAVRTLLAGGYFDLIKGNENEIRTVAGTAGDIQQRGVDSGASAMGLRERAALVRDLARRERNLVLMTGATDVLSDGELTLAIGNGHEYLGAITGSGCTLGTTVAAFLVAGKEQKIVAALAGVLLFEIAAERAAKREDVRGPGTFVPAFLDELYAIRKETLEGNPTWLEAAKVATVTF
ncbi:Hydroxyethylthiazole kinase family-domain-containing protein [Phyllosticta citribraziliensis]|uniref:Hydroxyethylthiazole kinase family-domain-containing protein n=1 Tax=Phyllosticta citribraziliensis TaxID=989973 RepID=A0ABR1M9V4_9PEZI